MEVYIFNLKIVARENVFRYFKYKNVRKATFKYKIKKQLKRGIK